MEQTKEATQSATIGELTEAVICVMKEVEGMEKNSRVGTGHSSYDGTRDADVKKAFNKAFVKNGLCIIPISLNDVTELERWTEESTYNGQVQKKNKQTVFTKVNTKYRLLHVSGEWITLVGYGHGVDSQDKGAGKATTYALKNCLLYTFLTPVGKIDDTDTTHSNDIRVPSNKPQVTRGAEYKVISDIPNNFWNAYNKNKQATLEHLGADGIRQIDGKWKLINYKK